LAKRKRKVAKRPAAAKSAARPRASSPAKPAPEPENSQIEYSNLSLHALFQQQAMAMLDRADLDEEQKQSILIAMNCPCCGAGGMSFTVKIKRRT